MIGFIYPPRDFAVSDEIGIPFPDDKVRSTTNDPPNGPQFRLGGKSRLIDNGSASADEIFCSLHGFTKINRTQVLDLSKGGEMIRFMPLSKPEEDLLIWAWLSLRLANVSQIDAPSTHRWLVISINIRSSEVHFLLSSFLKIILVCQRKAGLKQ